MARPTDGVWLELKTLGRYFVGKPRLQQVYAWQNVQLVLKAYADADWAWCKETRKPTIGGCIKLGRHTPKGWSKTQALIALGSGESEVYAALKSSAEALGMMALLQDFGYVVKGEIRGDASAALGIINRKGLGKTRHIQTGLLWIQQTAAEQRLRYAKVLGKEHPADWYTKFLDAATSNAHVQRLEYEFVGGRSIEAPQLHSLSQSVDSHKQGSTNELCEWVQILMQSVEKCESKSGRQWKDCGLCSVTNREDNQRIANHTGQFVDNGVEEVNKHCRNLEVWKARVGRCDKAIAGNRTVLRNGHGAGMEVDHIFTKQYKKKQWCQSPVAIWLDKTRCPRVGRLEA